MNTIDFEESNDNKAATEHNVQSTCLGHNSERVSSTKKRRTRGRNRPRPPSRRYRWKETIFGRGYPDLCALREGPYRPRQEMAKQADSADGGDRSE